MNESKQQSVPLYIYLCLLLLALFPLLWSVWEGNGLAYWVSFLPLVICFVLAAWLRRFRNGLVWWTIANAIGAAYPTLLSVVPYFRPAGIQAMRLAGVLSAIAFWLIAISGAAIAERIYRFKKAHMRTQRRYGGRRE